jgi:hypothetical protein
MAEFLEHDLREPISFGTASVVFEPFELSKEMRPAELPQSILVVAAVGGMVIRGNHPLVGATQYASEDFGSTACSNGEIYRQRRNEDPKIATIAFTFPSGLIDVEVSGFRQGLLHFLCCRFEFGTYSGEAITHTSKAEWQAKEGV